METRSIGKLGFLGRQVIVGANTGLAIAWRSVQYNTSLLCVDELEASVQLKRENLLSKGHQGHHRLLYLYDTILTLCFIHLLRGSLLSKNFPTSSVSDCFSSSSRITSSHLAF